MTYRAVIFDLDGTLLDTLQDLCDAMNRMLTDRGYPPHPLDAYRRIVGDGARASVKRSLPQEVRDDDGLVDACLAAFRQDYGENWAVQTRPYDGIPEMLDALTERGTPMAVLSNKPHRETAKCVEALLRNWTFASVLGQSEEIPAKPDPKGALHTADILGVPPAEILYVGDTDTDMQTARNAGMFSVGVLWGFRDREELESNGAGVVLEHPMELVHL